MAYRNMPSEVAEDYENYNVENRPNVVFLGVLSDDRPTVFDREEGVVREAAADHVNEQLSTPTEPDLEIAAGSIGEALEAIAEDLGWQSLSSAAHDHLESESENE